MSITISGQVIRQVNSEFKLGRLLSYNDKLGTNPKRRSIKVYAWKRKHLQRAADLLAERGCTVKWSYVGNDTRLIVDEEPAMSGTIAIPFSVAFLVAEFEGAFGKQFDKAKFMAKLKSPKFIKTLAQDIFEVWSITNDDGDGLWEGFYDEDFVSHDEDQD